MGINEISQRTFLIIFTAKKICSYLIKLTISLMLSRTYTDPSQKSSSKLDCRGCPTNDLKLKFKDASI